MRVAVASDHAGFDQKGPIVKHLLEEGYDVVDLGPRSGERCDYPDFGDKVGRYVASGKADRGVVICGTGLGISMAADKVPGVRATPVQTVQLTQTSRSSTPSSPRSLPVGVTLPASRRSCARTIRRLRAFPRSLACRPTHAETSFTRHRKPSGPKRRKPCTSST